MADGSDLPPILYHGTSDGYLVGMLKRGLDPASSPDGYLCYTDDIETARYHARLMANWDSGILGRACKPVLFALPTSRFTTDQFCLDANFIRLGASHGRASGQNLHDRAWTWQSLLSFAGAVGYRAILTVDQNDVFPVA